MFALTLAGARAALATDPRLSVVVIAKDPLAESNSAHAQGGIAAVLDPVIQTIIVAPR